MKFFTYFITIIGLALIAYNATKLNMNALFEGESIIAIITILAVLCAIILLQILRVSKKIETKSRR